MKTGGGTVFIPEGEFICGTVVLRDNIHIVFENGSVLLGSDNMDDFLPREENPANDVYQDKSHSYFQHSLFYADGCKNISFSGLGKIDMRSVWVHDGSAACLLKIFALKMHRRRDKNDLCSSQRDQTLQSILPAVKM